MKISNRILCLIFSLIMMLSSVPAVFAEESGMKFTAHDSYLPVKGLAETPNSFEAWVKLPRTAASDRSGVILGNYGAGRSIINFEIHKNGRPRLYWTDSKGETADWTFTGINVCTGKWVHVCIVRDLEASKVYCYIDGKLKQTLAITDKGREDTLAASGLCLGGDLRSGNVQYFKGEIRSAAIYSTVRTAEDINSAATDGLIAHYDLSGAKTDADVIDKSANGYDLRYSANELWIKPEDKAEVTDYAYSFAVVGDTQVMNYTYPDKFGAIYDWILDNIEKKNIRFVFGLGDITEKSGAAEWERAKEAIHSLDGKVEYNIVRGNHDSVATYTKAFPWTDYKDAFGGSFNSSMMYTYRTLEIGNVKYLLITLDYGANDKALEWAGKLCEQYPDHNVIITTHAYLFRDGTTLDQNDVCPPATSGGSNNGDHMWDKLISKHENIVLVISGHDPCDRVVLTQTKGEKGNTVSQMLVDPQSTDKSLGGLGMVAMLYFSEDGRNVTVEYYSTVKEMFYRSVNQFSFTMDTRSEPPVQETEPVTEPVTEPIITEIPQTEAPAPDNKEKGGSTALIIAASATTGAAIMAIAFTVITKAKKK